MPADFVSSLCFGGPDGRDLYITTIGSLFRTRVEVAGMPVASASVSLEQPSRECNRPKLRAWPRTP